MSLPRILLIGSARAKKGGLIASLEKRYTVTMAASGKQGIVAAAANTPNAIILDAVALRTPGERICHQLRERFPMIPLIHLHPGSEVATDSPADAVLLAPFTARKVLNALERLVPSGDVMLRCGPFEMDITRRVLIANGQETILTPKLARLVEMFLRHPGHTFERRTLMEKVWQTDYLGDTRTLDVHIRWIRQAIGDIGGSPRYLLTVRGVGYRLEVPHDSAENGRAR